MSHDIGLRCAHCDSTVHEKNITGNLTPMLREAGIYLGDEQWIDQPGSVMLSTVQRAIDRMVDCPPAYRALNPENGWGSYEVALETLIGLRDAIARNPDAVYYDHH